MKGVKGSETKRLIREAAYKQFLTKDYNTVPLKEIEKSLNLSRGCMSYHYPSKQELFIDVIDFYIFHKQDAKNKFKDISHTSLLEFIDYYIKKVEETMNAMRIYLIEKEKTNITRAYLNLILQAEYFYPGFNEAFNEITNKEIKLWERIFVKAVETKEIRSDVNPSTLALTFRILLFGKCFQDALVNGLRIEELKVVLYKKIELMKKDVFITGLASFFPNSPVSNDEMEEFLGLISGKHSKVQRIVLKQNGIKRRYYALNKNQEITHTNAEMAMLAIRKLLALTNKSQKDIELLACATATPDQILPSHASMVHGLWEEPVEIFSSAGVCLSCLQALKIAYLSIAASEKQNAICSTSELVSAMLLSKNFDIEYERCCNLGTNPYMALEKDFLRFMLSDGASCALLENHPGEKGVSLKIEWIEMDSYANETPTCMFAGAVRREDGELKSWKSFESQELVDESLMVIKQDIKLLGAKLMPLWIRHIKSCLNKHGMTPDDVDYVIPHSSSMVIYGNLIEAMKDESFELYKREWFTNLTWVGNIGSSAILAALDEFCSTRKLKSGEKILLLVPESGRFSYGTVLLSVV